MRSAGSTDSQKSRSSSSSSSCDVVTPPHIPRCLRAAARSRNPESTTQGSTPGRSAARCVGITAARLPRRSRRQSAWVQPQNGTCDRRPVSRSFVPIRPAPRHRGEQSKRPRPHCWRAFRRCRGPHEPTSEHELAGAVRPHGGGIVGRGTCSARKLCARPCAWRDGEPGARRILRGARIHARCLVRSAGGTTLTSVLSLKRARTGRS